jgi:hypothetical protein
MEKLNSADSTNKKASATKYPPNTALHIPHFDTRINSQLRMFEVTKGLKKLEFAIQLPFLSISAQSADVSSTKQTK